MRHGLLSGEPGGEVKALLQARNLVCTHLVSEPTSSDSRLCMLQIQIWRARGRMPLAVETTACLLELKHR